VTRLPNTLIGRSEEVLVIDRTLSGLGRGGSAAIEVAGEPGIGKTRLLAELATRADALGYLVLSGSASDLEADLPFWVFVDALDEYIAALEPRRLDALENDVLSELATVFPAVTPRASVPAAVVPQTRYRTYRAVRELLERLTAIKPLVLVLDDVHWADPASVELLGTLLRRPPEAAVLITLAVRPRQAPDRLSNALERAHRSGTLQRLPLRPLTREQAHDLLGDTVDDAVTGNLYSECGGNPFYLEQLARSLGRVAAPDFAKAHASLLDLDVPAAVAAALAEEFALLTAEERLVLQGAAVAGDPFRPELAAAAANTSEALALDALDALLKLDLIRQTDVPRRFRFRHPLVRRAVEKSTPAAWSLGAHERCAAALERQGASAAERAHHIALAGRPGDMAAVAALREAGETTAQRAPAIAAIWFCDALRLLPETAPAESRVELLLSRARALAATGQFTQSHAALLESFDLVPPEAVALRIQLTTACAGVEHLLGRHEQAHARLVSAMESVSEQSSPAAAELMIALAMDGFALMDYGRMRDWAERAVNTAHGLGDRPLAAAATAVHVFACAADGAIAVAKTHRHEATAMVADLSDHQLALHLDTAVHLAGAELYLDCYPEAEAHADRAIAVGLATGQSELVPLAYSILGQVKLLRGQLDEAAELLDNVVDGARLSGNVQALAGDLINRSLTAVVAGNIDLALSTAEESVELTNGLDQSLVTAAGVALATALLESGDPSRAVDVLLRSSGGEELLLVPGVWRARSLELLTRCWLAVGRQREATLAASLVETVATRLTLPVARSMADRALAAVALAAGTPEVAAQHALASAATADEVGMPVDAAFSRTLGGRALALSAQRDRAIAQLWQAADQFHACGALRYRAAAEFELRRLGQRLHRRTRPGDPRKSGVQSLTSRELEIARLVVDRRTNPEIAEALFLSPKTVETHLRHLFHKLDVSSRVEVARVVERSDPLRSSAGPRPTGT
jgi:DNA-binding CsgD family transcriptional regulator/Cdc6-like AAA superfamily ATPase